MRVKRAIEESDVTIPYCAFNGGADVFIDVGNKRTSTRVSGFGFEREKERASERERERERERENTVAVHHLCVILMAAHCCSISLFYADGRISDDGIQHYTSKVSAFLRCKSTSKLHHHQRSTSVTSFWIPGMISRLET